MPDITTSLVPNEQAAEFLDTFSLPTARNAHAGNPADFEGHTHEQAAVTRANEALRDGIKIIRRLVNDETKPLVTKHEAAERVADQVDANLIDTEKTLQAAAERQFSHGADIVNDAFKLRTENVAVDWRLMEWVAAQAAKPDGAAILREAVTSDRDIAAIVWAGKPMILGLSADLLGTLKMAAVKAHLKNAEVHFENARKFSAAAQRYPQIRRSMRASFYNKALADRARATRVDV